MLAGVDRGEREPGARLDVARRLDHSLDAFGGGEEAGVRRDGRPVACQRARKLRVARDGLGIDSRFAERLRRLPGVSCGDRDQLDARDGVDDLKRNTAAHVSRRPTGPP